MNLTLQLAITTTTLQMVMTGVPNAGRNTQFRSYTPVSLKCKTIKTSYVLQFKVCIKFYQLTWQFSVKKFMFLEMKVFFRSFQKRTCFIFSKKFFKIFYFFLLLLFCHVRLISLTMYYDVLMHKYMKHWSVLPWQVFYLREDNLVEL